ncbi:MAG TPA: WYL domain-containing protein [Rariglobus sp.]|nr:WYL domain-containing protein [Rariglobus sp.]
MKRMKRLRGWVLGVVCAIACAQASFGVDEDTAGVLREALRTRAVVTFTYKGQARTVEPHALGMAGDDKPALLAWQTSGGSNTEPPSGWRVFIVAEIAGLKVTERKFEKPRADYNAKARGLKSVETDVRASEEAPAVPATAEK